MANKKTVLGLGAFAAVATIAGASAFAGLHNQEEASQPPQDYVPTQEDITHAENLSNEFYTVLNTNIREIVAHYKSSSLDGEGRVLPAKNDIFEIRNAPVEGKTYTIEPGKYQSNSIYSPSGIEMNKSLWNLYNKEDFSQKEFDNLHDRILLLGVTGNDSIALSPVTATYNIASGRICELKDSVNVKYEQDCYSLKDLTPGTKLAADIDMINKSRATQPPAPAM